MSDYVSAGQPRKRTFDGGVDRLNALAICCHLDVLSAICIMSFQNSDFDVLTQRHSARLASRTPQGKCWSRHRRSMDVKRHWNTTTTTSFSRAGGDGIVQSGSVPTSPCCTGLERGRPSASTSIMNRDGTDVLLDPVASGAARSLAQAPVRLSGPVAFPAYRLPQHRQFEGDGAFAALERAHQFLLQARDVLQTHLSSARPSRGLDLGGGPATRPIHGDPAGAVGAGARHHPAGPAGT